MNKDADAGQAPSGSGQVNAGAGGERSQAGAAKAPPDACPDAPLAAAPDNPPVGPGSHQAGRHSQHRRNERRRSGRFSTGPFYAALDLGTNNCRLLVAEPRGDTFKVVDSFSRIVRLGEGLTQTGRLRKDAMNRTISALRICRSKIHSRDMAGVRMIATEACRQAENGEFFLARVRNELGLELEVIDRRTEARLAVAGCRSLLDPETDGALLFDIGGGSSEIVWLDRRKTRRQRGLIRAWVSLPIGVVTLAERHGGVDIDDRAFEAMVADVRESFGAFHARHALSAAIAKRDFHFLGTSGTVTTLAGVHLDLPRYDRRFVDGLWMADDEIERMMTKIRSMDYRTRAANPCIGRERADLVLAGCAIFEAIRREWPCRRLRVADRGLREGILVQMMRADGHLRPCRDGSRPPQANRGPPQGKSGWSASRPCNLRSSDKPIGKGNAPPGDRAKGLDSAGNTSLD
ncbi:MAG: Ppx/GppA family phosphatase [Alphaproteobacteria bacterium]|nr:MAG: Ppx/GppA family phosphatase [Alphaproteobacteria bacterium]